MAVINTPGNIQYADFDTKLIVGATTENSEPLQTVPQDTVIGRQSSGAGNAEYVACTAAGRAIIAAANAAAQRAVLDIAAYFLSLSGGTLTGNLTLDGDPTTNLQAATKAYVDAAVTAALQGLNFHNDTYAVTLVNFAATYNNGVSGVGATLTSTSFGAFSADGVTVPQGQRVLIASQTSALENGIYNVTVAGDGVTNTVLTRSADYDTTPDVSPGDLVPVVNGNTQAGSIWRQTQNISAIGIDAINFVIFNNSPGAYLLKSNNLSDVASVTAARGSLSVPSNTGSGASGTWSIDISGNAATATSATTASTATSASSATNANNVVTSSSNANAAHFLAFLAANLDIPQAVRYITGLQYNPSTNTLSAGIFSGALQGNATTATTAATASSATTATTATNANNVATTSVSANQTYFPLFVASLTNSNQPANLDIDLKYNASTNTLQPINLLANSVAMVEGINARQGAVSLVAGSAIVTTNVVSANSRIILTQQTSSGTNNQYPYVSARVVGTSFTISGQGTAQVAYLVIN